MVPEISTCYHAAKSYTKSIQFRIALKETPLFKPSRPSLPYRSRSSSQPRPSVRQESLKYESESSRIPVRLSIRCITGLWARYSSHPILSIIISLLYSLPGHAGAPTTALKEGNKLDVMRGTGMIAPLSWSRFLEDEEPEFEYPLDVELIDANPIFDFRGT